MWRTRKRSAHHTTHHSHATYHAPYPHPPTPPHHIAPLHTHYAPLHPPPPTTHNGGGRNSAAGTAKGGRVDGSPPAGSLRFDVVVLDEAAAMLEVDAVGCLLHGARGLLLVGDQERPRH